jgi:predicted TIM-barrel fold metal-dependent hydrolase
MWIPKFVKDQLTGNDSPIPTQIISNEEFSPYPQTPNQKRVEARIHELADDRARRLGMTRRHFLRTSSGMAAAFVAMNDVFGPHFDVHAEETLDATAYAERWPKGQFVFDVQNHHVRSGGPYPLPFRKLSGAFNKALEGIKPQNSDLELPNFTKEIFFDSDTTIGLISGVPSRLLDVINVDEMVDTRDRLNELAGSQRMLSHGLVAPYVPDFLGEIERQASELGVDAWKCYTGIPEYKGEYPWRMDDEELIYPFYDLIRKFGKTVVCVHKGLPLPGSDHEYVHPGDMRKAALDNPDIDFVVYHSAFKAANYELPEGDGFVGENGYLAWTTDICRDRLATPEMTNVYMELGTSFGHTVITHPDVCGHLLGQVIQAFGVDHVIFGTDSIWWGAPQWQIEAMRRFQIPEHLQEQYGYAPITDLDREKILGLNAARLFGVDVDAARQAFPDDGIARLKAQYAAEGGEASNTQYGWVRRFA